MNNFKETYEKLLLEYKKFKAFDEYQELNEAADYINKFMRNNGVNRPASYHLWDYLYKSTPLNIREKTSEIALRKGLHTTDYRPFMVNFFKRNIQNFDIDSYIEYVSNDRNILYYIQRPNEERGNRSRGMSREYSIQKDTEMNIIQKVQDIFDRLAPKIRSRNVSRGRKGLPILTGTIIPNIDDNILMELGENDMNKILQYVKLRNIGSTVNIEKFMRRYNRQMEMKKKRSEDLDEMPSPSDEELDDIEDFDDDDLDYK